METDEKKTPQRTFTANLFIHRLQRTVSKKILMHIILGMILFVFGFYFMTYSSNESNAAENLDILKDVYLKLYDQSMEFLNEENTVQAFFNYLENRNSHEFEYLFNRLQTKSIVKNEMILADAEGKLIGSSFPAGELSNYLVDYNSAICYNVKNSNSHEIYVATYFDTGNYSDYMFVKPVFEGSEIRGYISLFIMGNDWNYYLSNESYDGIIVDERQNVIYRSKAGFANQSGIFRSQAGRIWTYNGKRYWVKKETLPDHEVTIYSLVYYPQNNTYLIGVLVIMIMGFSWFYLANWMSTTMAEYNARQVSRLVSEIRQIQNGDHLHRIHMGTDDEFDEVGHRINRMLDSVRELNNKNTELIMLNARLEMGQLETQMNPHFLYNTLEIIRNLVLLDARKAEELIERLVHILRYSVNRTYRDVHLQEDMKYIKDYLYIQNMRFNERFRCEMTFEQECEESMIPKLLLQPIIENTIKYGFKEKMEIHMWIRGHMEGNFLIISAKDDGPGMPEKQAKELSDRLAGGVIEKTDSVGLYNISRRLKLQYGENSGMTIVNCPGEGFEVIFRIEQKQ